MRGWLESQQQLRMSDVSSSRAATETVSQRSAEPPAWRWYPEAALRPRAEGAAGRQAAQPADARARARRPRRRAQGFVRDVSRPASAAAPRPEARARYAPPSSALSFV